MNDKSKTCAGCIDRRPGCHAGCLEYLERSKAIREANEARRKQVAAQNQIDDYERDGYRKRNRSIKRRSR